MFTEDYLMRIINQAISVLMTAIGLRKAGKNSEAQQAIQQGIEQLTTLPAYIVDQMEDGSILSMLSAQGQLDVGRLAILGQLYQEQGEILLKMDQPGPGTISFAHALRFFLEVALTGEDPPPSDKIIEIEALVKRIEGQLLPIETQLAFSDYYQRLLGMDDKSLSAAGLTINQVHQQFAKLKNQPNPS
jgi:hypothetical protein